MLEGMGDILACVVLLEGLPLRHVNPEVEFVIIVFTSASFSSEA